MNPNQIPTYEEKNPYTEFPEDANAEDYDDSNVGEQIAETDEFVESPFKETLSKVWSTILTDGFGAADTSNITPTEALELVGRWPQLPIADVPKVGEKFYEIMRRALDLLVALQEEFPDHLQYAGYEEADHSSEFYTEVALRWNVMFYEEDRAWSCADPHAMATLIAIFRARELLVSGDGLFAQINVLGIRVDQAAFEAEFRARVEAKEEQ